MTKDELILQPWFAELKNDVQLVLDQDADQTTYAAAMKEEVAKAEKQLQGWIQSLSNPDLETQTRRLIESQMQNTADRINDLKLIMAEKEAQTVQRDSLVDPNAISEGLQNLARVLTAHNPSLINIELSQHIDRIDCHADGRAVLRTCRLGVLGEAMDVFSVDDPCVQGDPPDALSTNQVQPRRLARRRIASEGQPTEKLKALAAWSTNPHRFAGLDERWFDKYEFRIPEPSSWSADHAMEVAAKRQEGLSLEELATHFGRSIPTIRKALRRAIAVDPELEIMMEKKPRRRWHEDHVLDVANLISDGLNVPQIAQQFGKSEPTIRKAIKHARNIGVLPPAT